MMEKPRFLTAGNVLASIAIVLAVTLILVTPRHSAPTDSAPIESPSVHVILELQAKLVVGVSHLDRSKVEAQLKQLTGLQQSAAGRRCLAALYAYLDTPDDRARALEQLPPEPDRGSLDRLAVKAISSPQLLSPQDREDLLSSMGWFGQLLLAPSEPDLAQAIRTESTRFVTAASLLSLMLVAALGMGALLLVLALLRRAQGALPFRFQRASSHTNLYFQAFAVYLCAMILFSVAAQLLGRSSAVWSATAILLALISSAAYPLLRGVPFQTFREDLGLDWGRGPIREVAAGVVAYLAMFPVLALGLLLTLLLQKLVSSTSGEASTPISHPIYGMIPEASAQVLILLFLIAAVLGPIAEEIMFRGALYRALRGYLGAGLSLLLMSFLFAAVHPQGALAIPSLMAMAISFGMMREWRSSLVAGIVTHGLHNAALLLTIFAALA